MKFDKRQTFGQKVRDIWDNYGSVILMIGAIIAIFLALLLVIIIPNSVRAEKVDGGVVIDKCIIGQYGPSFWFVVYVQTDGEDIVKTVEVSVKEYYSVDVGDTFVKD